MNWRKAVAVWLRDEGRCFYCDAQMVPEKAHIDHRLPRSSGGTDEIANLVVACIPCNTAKSDKHPLWADLWLKDGQPWCVARMQYEKDVLLISSNEFWPGVLWVNTAPGEPRRWITAGQCGWPGCPDCADLDD
jgi:hypothetical protein